MNVALSQSVLWQGVPEGRRHGDRRLRVRRDRRRRHRTLDRGTDPSGGPHRRGHPPRANDSHVRRQDRGELGSKTFCFQFNRGIKRRNRSRSSCG